MALIRGKEVKAGPKQLPANPKLWNMYVAQAKSRFRVYPSPAAAHWVHTRYTQVGGKFVDKQSEVDPRFRDYVQERMDAQLESKKKKVTKPIGKNTIAGEKFRG